MACEALLCLIKPFLIALLFSCLLSKASELSSPSSNPVSPLFRKGGETFLGFPNSTHSISKSLQTGDSQTLQSLPSSPTWAGKGWNPIKLHPNPHKAPSPNPQGCSGNSSRWQLSSSPARTSLFAPPGPVFTCISAGAAAASPHSLLRPVAETLLAPDSCNAAQGKASRALGLAVRMQLSFTSRSSSLPVTPALCRTPHCCFGDAGECPAQVTKRC